MRTTGALWRDTARPVRFLALDARVLTGLAAWMLHMCWGTFWLSVGIMVVFAILERFGVTPPAAWRYARMGLFGPRRDAGGGYAVRRRMRW